jgi:CubicO group peptidase (beta-lactamase class C family)
MLVALFVLQAVALDSLATERVAGPLGARLDTQLSEYADSGFWGTVLVVKDRHILLLKGYGFADSTRHIHNTPATRFEMNSMTKMFTGVAVLQLAAGRRLKLDDPIERYLPGFSAEKRDATIKQLASHTSGLIVEGSTLAGDSRAAFVRDMQQTPREAPAGAQYRYTNAGYSLLAAIIEVASGERYEAYLRKHAFEPAGMRSARFRDEISSGDTLFAHGYGGTPNPYVWGTRGAGGAWMTVGDMYRWLVAVEDGIALPASQRSLLFSPPAPPSQEAFGWHVSPTRIDKGGGSADFQSQLLYYPADRVVIIWTCNNLRRRWRQTLNQTLAWVVAPD